MRSWTRLAVTSRRSASSPVHQRLTPDYSSGHPHSIFGRFLEGVQATPPVESSSLNSVGSVTKCQWDSSQKCSTQPLLTNKMTTHASGGEGVMLLQPNSLFKHTNASPLHHSPHTVFREASTTNPQLRDISTAPGSTSTGIEMSFVAMSPISAAPGSTSIRPLWQTVPLLPLLQSVPPFPQPPNCTTPHSPNSTSSLPLRVVVSSSRVDGVPAVSQGWIRSGPLGVDLGSASSSSQPQSDVVPSSASLQQGQLEPAEIEEAAKAEEVAKIEGAAKGEGGSCSRLHHTIPAKGSDTRCHETLSIKPWQGILNRSPLNLALHIPALAIAAAASHSWPTASPQSALCESAPGTPATPAAIGGAGGEGGPLWWTLAVQAHESITDSVALCLDAFHGFLVAPWWLSIAAATIALRLILLPLTIKQMRVAGQLSLLAPKLPPPFPMPGSGATWKGTRRRYNKRLKELGAPSSLWLFLAPLVQVPVFFSWVVSLRHMASCDHPGFDTGGALWFNDLCAIPSGPLAWVAPSAIALTFLLSIQVAFAPPPVHQGLSPSAARPHFLSRSHLPLILALYSFWLELLSIPTFFTCLYLVPQAVHMYWLTNNLISIAQGLAARNDNVRRAVGIPTFQEIYAEREKHAKARAMQKAARDRWQGSAVQNDKEGFAPSGVGPGQPYPNGSDPDGFDKMEHSSSDPQNAQQAEQLESNNNVAFLLEVASQMKSSGNNKGALEALRRAARLDRENESVWLGLGNVLFDGKNFTSAAEAFQRAASVAPADNLPAQLIALRGAGFSFFNQGDLERAEEMLHKAASLDLESSEHGKDPLHRRWHGTAMVALASLLTRKRKGREALTWLQKAAEYDPSIKEAMIVPLEEKIILEERTTGQSS